MMVYEVSSRRTLPHDVLCIIFETVAIEDKNAALKFAAISRLVQRWIERIIYSVVNLYRDKAHRAFLRTIETSKIKSRSFFFTHVKSLCIAYDLYDHRTTRIIRVCQGVTNLTFWAVPSWSPICYQPYQEIAQVLGPLRPKKLSMFLTGVLNGLQPQFDAPSFQNVTHLSVINRWEDWSTWSGFELLPCLTHLSFELCVGPNGLCHGAARLISGALNDILGRCSRLRVCSLVFIFDMAPHLSAAKLSSAGMDGSDPRVVFVNNTQPFLGREAHSVKEAGIWELAERAVSDRELRKSGGVPDVFRI